MRCFIAVDVDSKLKEKILDIEARLKGLDIKLVEDFHFTLKFLGEVDVKTLDEVKSRLNKLTETWAAFEISIEGLGAGSSLSTASRPTGIHPDQPAGR